MYEEITIDYRMTFDEMDGLCDYLDSADLTIMTSEDKTYITFNTETISWVDIFEYLDRFSCSIISWSKEEE